MILAVLAVVLIIAPFGYYSSKALVPVNTDFLVFGMPSNIYIKAMNSPTDENVFALQSSKGGKIAPLHGSQFPTITVQKDNLVSLHFINEDRNIPNSLSKHNLNIDEFNVHTDDLGNFQTQTVTFLADKIGTYEFYCSIYPEMKGTIIVE